MNISVFGLGKLGSVIAALYAGANHKVIGVDVDVATVAAVNAGLAPVKEPGLADLMSRVHPNLSATIDADAAIAQTDVSFLILPTPSLDDGSFSNDYLVMVLRKIGVGLAKKSTRHTVVICSTVMPGSSDGELAAVLEESSGLHMGTGFGFVYSPEFIALGSVIRDMQYPDLVLIGESDEMSGDLVEELARSVILSQPTFAHMNLVNAELTKIALNTFLTTKISFANMVGEFCESLRGADVDVVTAAIGADSRVGSKYLKGALGYGGPCFPRDNRALSSLGRRLGVPTQIPDATDAVNDRQVQRVLHTIGQRVTRPGRVAVLGLSYKPDTSVTEGSQGVAIANGLAQMGFLVSASDPQALPECHAELLPGIITSTRAQDVLVGATAVVVATAWSEYSTLNIPPSLVVLDPWGAISPEVSSRRQTMKENS